MKNKYRYKFRGLGAVKFIFNPPLLALTISLILVQGCRKFVEIAPPVTMPTAGSVFDNATTATGAQLGIYLQMFGESVDKSAKFGMLADELTSYSTDGFTRLLYINSLSPAFAYGGSWSPAYNYIYQANSVIEGLAASNSIPAAIKKQLTGEALFLRSFWNLYLTSWYGDIPLVNSTDYKANNLLKRTPNQQVCRQIISDLKQAETLLNSEYVDQSDTAISTDRTRPNASAAEAVLARAYLYSKVYDSAEIEATNVINNSMYTLEPNLNNVFLAGSQEAIWQLQTPQPNTMQAIDGNQFILLAAPDLGVTNCWTISPQLMSSFEPGDGRMTSWIGVYTDNTVTPAVSYYYPFKYQVHDASNNPGGRTEYPVVLRLAEQYLIRAEARAMQNNSSGALSDLNAIRHRAGLGDYAGATDQASLVAAILHERQVELFTEWGHRWLDLVRTGNANTVMLVVAPQKGGTWSADGHQQLLPIPQGELSLDYNLTQNPGY